MDLGVGITGGSVDCRDTPDQRQGQGGGEVTLRKLSSPGGAGGVEDVSSRGTPSRGTRPWWVQDPHRPSPQTQVGFAGSQTFRGQCRNDQGCLVLAQLDADAW